MSAAGPAGRGRRRLLWTGLSLLALVFCLDVFNAFDLLEYKSLDLRFRLRGPRPLTAPAVIVAIDDPSLNGWVGPDGRAGYMPERWIWPRDFYAQVLRNLKDAGARLVAFDLVFSESTKRDPAQDRAFGDAARAAGNVIFIERADPRTVDGMRAIKVETLIPPLAASAAGIGFVNLVPSADGFLRGFQPLLSDSGGAPDPDMPNADLAVLGAYLGLKGKPSYDPALDAVRLGDRVIPMSDGSTDVNYLGPAGTVPTVSFHDVYNKTMDMGLFKGKIVYIGSNSEIMHDQWLTPFSGGRADFSGVEARVHFLDTLLTQRYLRHPPDYVEPLAVLVLGLAMVLLAPRLSAVAGLLVVGLAGGLWAAGAVAAFRFDWVLPVVAPLAALVVPFAGTALLRGVREEKESRQVRQMFSKYVSSQIVDEILRHPETVKLGGDVKETTILFADVRGFTALSERMGPSELVDLLNEYLSAMVDVIIANDGTVDKYVGDAIMAVWGSPLPDLQHRRKALRAAVQMMEALGVLRERWRAAGRPLVDIGIGLNTGTVVAGNMGHPRYKMDYTVIGDAVNLAARMETANRELGSHILLTTEAFAGCEDLVDTQRHPPIKVKGKDAPVEVIEVLGWKGQGRAPWAAPLPRA